ncbi:MAG: hypothetical protein PWP62_49 [Eubacteriaceae bacterium]|jgi:hypothetical protein|nr:hypothetical protein [Eubacteriaceae bacterium]
MHEIKDKIRLKLTSTTQSPSVSKYLTFGSRLGANSVQSGFSNYRRFPLKI